MSANKSNNPIVIKEIGKLKNIVQFAIVIKRKKIIHNLYDLSFKDSTLTCSNNGQQMTVCGVIKKILNNENPERNATAQWSSYLHFIDGYGKIQKFNKYMEKVCNYKM